MDSVIQLLVSQLGSGAVGKISEQLGVDESQAQQAVGMALPLILDALTRNASWADGAQALTNALQRDHDGSILNNLPQAITRPEVRQDEAVILRHVLGDHRAPVQNSVSRATGMDPNQVAQIFAILAPVVLGGLGQIQRKNNLDAQGVSTLLQEERTSVEKTGLAQLLDMDGDGDVSEEIVTLGANLLGGLFGGKK